MKKMFCLATLLITLLGTWSHAANTSFTGGAMPTGGTYYQIAYVDISPIVHYADPGGYLYAPAGDSYCIFGLSGYTAFKFFFKVNASPQSKALLATLLADKAAGISISPGAVGQDSFGTVVEVQSLEEAR